MSEIIQELKNKIRPELEEMALELSKEGWDRQDITKYLVRTIQMRMSHFYKKDSEYTQVNESLNEFWLKFDGKKTKQDADSKAEQIFYDALWRNKIGFEFQYTIGPYRVDYLINKYLIIELDGSLHSKKKDEIRDKYLQKMGYKVVRLPLWLVAMDCDAAIESIREMIQIR